MAKIVFLCVNNSNRGQMAVGLANSILGNQHEIYSAGSNPKAEINLDAIKAMADIDIDISKQKITAIADLPLEILNDADFIITLCENEICPFLNTRAQMIHWPIQNPNDIHSYDNSETYKHTRDIIKEKLESFAKTHINNNNVISLQTSSR